MRGGADGRIRSRNTILGVSAIRSEWELGAVRGVGEPLPARAVCRSYDGRMPWCELALTPSHRTPSRVVHTLAQHPDVLPTENDAGGGQD